MSHRNIAVDSHPVGTGDVLSTSIGQIRTTILPMLFGGLPSPSQAVLRDLLASEVPLTMARARRSNRGDGFRSTIGKACNAPLIRRRFWATRPAETVTKNIACNSASVAGLG